MRIFIILLSQYLALKEQSMRKFLYSLAVVAIASFVFCESADAQQVSVGTNMIDWANHGTANLSVTTSVGAHMSIGATARYNPWFFKEGTLEQKNHALRGASLEFRYWPWHVYSGWWFMLKGQTLEYNYGNLFGKSFSEQGRAYGAGLGAGYALMIGTHWNVDFGLTLWGGTKDYKRYDCSFCGMPLEEGKKAFFMPDNVFVTFCYIF